MIKLFGGSTAVDSLSIQLEGKAVAVAAPPSIYESCLFVPVVRALMPLCGVLDLVAPESMASFWEKITPGVRMTVVPDGAGAREIAGIMKDGGAGHEVSLAWDHTPVAEAFAKLKIRCRAGYEMPGFGKTLTEVLKHDDEPGRHQVHYYLDLLKGMGIDAFVAANFQTPPLPPRGPQARIALVPGSELGTAFKWPIDRFVELAQRLQAGCDAELVILSLPGMVNEANELARRLHGQAKNFAGQFDVPGLMDAIPYCSLMIANDGSLPLLAGHVGLPAVVIYGPSEPGEVAPFGNQHSLLTVNAVCSPCRQMACLYDHHECMQDMTVEQVLQAAAAYLLPTGRG
jgi:hypothetical protein